MSQQAERVSHEKPHFFPSLTTRGYSMFLQPARHQSQCKSRLVPMYAHLYRACLLGLLAALLVSPVNAEPLTIEIVGGGAGPSTPPTGCGYVLGLNSESYLLCPTQQANVSDDGVETVKVQTRPNAPLMQDIPAGWNPPAAGQMQPTPPATAAKLASTYYGSVYGFTGDSIQAVCQRAADLRNSTLISFNGGQCIDSTSGGNPMETVTLVSNICPRGYTNAGSNCTLSNAAQVDKPNDGKCTVLRSGNTFSGDPQDPDCGLSQRSSKGLSIGTNSVSVTKGGDSATITANTTDSTITIVNKQSDVATNSTKVGTTTVNQQYNISGFKQETFNGVGTQQSSTPIAPTAPGGGGTSIDVSSLNKESTQQAIKAGQCGGPNQPACKIDEGNISNSQTQSDTDNTRQRGELNTKFSELEQKIAEQTNGVGSGLSNSFMLSLIPSGGGCVNPSIDASDVASGAVATLSICEHAEDWQPFLRWFAYFFTVIGIWGLFHKRLGGAA